MTITIIIAALAVALSFACISVTSYIKFLKQRVDDTEKSNESYSSALRVISNKQPGLVNEAFREIGEEEVNGAK